MTQYADTSNSSARVSETIWYGTECGTNSAIIGPGPTAVENYKSHKDPDQAFYQIDRLVYATNLVNCPVNRTGIKVVNNTDYSSLEGVTLTPLDTSDRVFPLNRTKENSYTFRLEIPDVNATYHTTHMFHLDVGCVRKSVIYEPPDTRVTTLVIDHEGRGLYEIINMTI